MLATHITELIERIRQANAAANAKDDGPLISVHPLTQRAGTWYEKVRNLIDFQEGRVAQRGAIERFVRRVVTTGNAGAGSKLLHELVDAGYLPNNQLTEAAANAVDVIIAKWFAILSTAAGAARANERFIVNLAANELHRHLFPCTKEDATAAAFYTEVRPRIRIPGNVAPERIDLAVVCATRRNLLNETDAELAYTLFLRYAPNWAALDARAAEWFVTSLPALKGNIEGAILDPLAQTLAPKLKNDSIYFFFVRELIERYGSESERIFTDDAQLKTFITESVTEKYKIERKSVASKGTRAIIYIFLTKMLLALSIELPYEIFFMGAHDIRPLATNVLFHPFLLFVLTRGIGKLGKGNTDLILAGVAAIARGVEQPAIHAKLRSRRTFLNIVFLGMYSLLTLVSFGFILGMLRALQFNIVSIALFLFFLALISYLGLRIRYAAGRWRVVPEKESLLRVLWDIFTLPIIRVGRWLNQTFSSINIFVFIMDFILETPFKTMLRATDAFLRFLKDKREELS